MLKRVFAFALFLLLPSLSLAESACEGAEGLYLVVDKSHSMAQDELLSKIKQSISENIGSLTSTVSLTIIGFDTVPLIVLPATTMDEQGKTLAASRIQNLFPMGRGEILPALGLVRQRIKTASLSCNRVVIISDWRLTTPLELMIPEVQSLKTLGAEVSAIALGTDGNFAVGKKLTLEGNGKFFHVMSASQLSKALGQIFASK